MIDLHNDTLLKTSQCNLSFVDGSKHLHVDLPKILSSQVEGIFFSIWANPAFKGKACTSYVLQSMAAAQKMINMLDITTCKGAIAIEGGFCLNDDPAQITLLCRQGLKMLTLTHFSGPSWAGSDQETGKNLNALGEKIVSTLEEHGVVVDVAHASTETILATARIAKKPFIYSHGGVRFLNPNSSRCISDEAIAKICDHGGLIGISFCPLHLSADLCFEDGQPARFWEELAERTALPHMDPYERLRIETTALLLEYPQPTKRPGIGAVFAHIDYVVQHFGDDFVAIGSDFDGMPFCCDGLENIARINALEQFMANKGYAPPRIKKILSGNASRFLF